MGGSQVISYHLQWDKASSEAQWYDIIGLSPTSLVQTMQQTNEIIGGLTYSYRVRA